MESLYIKIPENVVNRLEQQFNDADQDSPLRKAKSLISASYVNGNVAIGDDHHNPLQYAIIHGHINITKYLIEKNWDINNIHYKNSFRTSNKMTRFLLLLTIFMSPFSLIPLFITLFSIVDYYVTLFCLDDETPLLLGTAHNQLSIVEYLLSKGAHPYVPNYKGYTALHLAVLNNNVALLELFRQSNINIHYKFFTPLSKYIQYFALPSALELAIQKNQLTSLAYFAKYTDINTKFGFSEHEKSYPSLVWLLLTNAYSAREANAKLVLFTLFRISASTIQRFKMTNADALPPARRLSLELWTRIATFYFLNTLSSQQIQQFKTLVHEFTELKIESTQNNIYADDNVIEIVDRSITALACHHNTYISNMRR